MPHNFSEQEVLDLLEKQGYTRVFTRTVPPVEAAREARTQEAWRRRRAAVSRPSVVLEMIQDRVRLRHGRSCAHHRGARSGTARRARACQRSCASDRSDSAAREVDADNDRCSTWRFSSDLHCADCDIHYQDPTPSLFSFNSPLGACEILPRLRPHHRHRLRPDRSGRGARRCAAARCGPGRRSRIANARTISCKFARKRGVPVDLPWRIADASAAQLGAGRRRRAGRTRSGTACAASSPGSRPGRTRCTSACCCRSIARIRRAQPATARA